MRTFAASGGELLASLSVPILVIPFATSWISRFLLAWSLAVLFFTAWRLIRSAHRIQFPITEHDVRNTARRVFRRLAFSTSASDLLPVLWIGTLWVVEQSTRALLTFEFVRHAVERAPSSTLMGAGFWLLLFGLVAMLIRASRRACIWHLHTIDGAFRTLISAERLAKEPLALEGAEE